MKENLLEQNPIPSARISLARLSEPHGYRIAGDTAHLHARFTVLHRSANAESWALQLWACPSIPTSASELAGQVVAEVALPPMSEVADDTEHVDMTAFACPPAGSAEHHMALVLASGRPGQFQQIHDIVVYPLRQQFLQPRLAGTAAYRVEGGQVHLTCDRIANPRDAANQSGTLSLELWALSRPYRGGGFQGAPVDGVVLGSLPGQQQWGPLSFALPFSAPPAGEWHLVLMLREYTSAGYVTRDFVNFATTYANRPAPALAVPASAAPKPPEPAPAQATVGSSVVKPATVAAAGLGATPSSAAAPKAAPAPIAAKARSSRRRK